MAIVNATNFRKNIFQYLNNAILSNDVVTATTKLGKAVIISEEEYKGIMETAYLNSIPGLTEKLIEGKNTPSNELVEIDWKKWRTKLIFQNKAQKTMNK